MEKGVYEVSRGGVKAGGGGCNGVVVRKVRSEEWRAVMGVGGGMKG